MMIFTFEKDFQGFLFLLELNLKKLKNANYYVKIIMIEKVGKIVEKRLDYEKIVVKVLTLLVVLMGGFNWQVEKVEAQNYTLFKGDKLYYSSDGTYKSSGSGYVIKHYLGTSESDKKEAYCIEWTKSTKNKSTYKPYTSSAITTEKRLIAGRIIEEVNSESLSSNEKHLYTMEALNCLFNLKGGKCLSKGKSYVTSAKNYVANFEKRCTGTYKEGSSTCFNYNKYKLSVSKTVMSQISGTDSDFLSKKITLSGLLSSYGGSDTSYKISYSGSADVSFCDKNGKNCKSSITLENPTDSSTSFYVRVNNASGDESIKITAYGVNTATYAFATAYRYTSSYQMLMLNGSKSFTRKIYRTLTLTVPSKDEVSIYAEKMDENGEQLEGASFEVYSIDKDNNQKTLFKNQNGGATASGSLLEFSNNLADYKFCLVETKAPIGYIFGDEEKKAQCIDMSTVSTTSSSTCLKSDGTEEDDLNYCKTATYECESDTTLENGQCIVTKEPTCPEGSTLSETSGKCAATSTEQEGTVVETDPTCDSGYEYSGATRKCVLSTAASCKIDGEVVDDKYCSKTDTYTLVEISDGNVSFMKENRKNNLTVSKTDITGETELEGAVMKVCSTKPDTSLDCEVVYTTQEGTCDEEDEEYGFCVNNDDETKKVYMSWISSSQAKYLEGFEAGKTYYLVETVAPRGYTVSSYTSFVVNSDGSVTSGGTTVSDNKILVKDETTKISISKQDLATSEELPGATLKICNTGKNEDGELVMSVDELGNCSIASLADGSEAKWTSTSTPQEIEGLAAGTYYLVEEVGPEGYETAENILFTLNADGSLSDENGKDLADNKLVMYDEEIENEKTGNVVLIVLASILGISLAVIGYSYKKYKNPSLKANLVAFKQDLFKKKKILKKTDKKD